jgi:hypothetical protein
MVHQTTESRQEQVGYRIAPYIVAVTALVVGSAFGLVLIEWLFNTLYGTDALGMFLLGFAGGVVLVALVGSQLTHVPLWLVLIAGQMVTLLGLLLLLI